MAIKNNKIVYSDTWNEFKSTDNVHIASVTKSIISLLIEITIDKGMPIEQVQHLLGHTKIDITLHYAFVNQNNVKIFYRKYIC